MNARGIFGFLLTLLAVGLLIGIGAGIYQMGVAQGIVDAGRFPAGQPVPVGGYGYGWHGGPGIFGILFGLFFLFLLFGLLRAVFWRGRGWGGGWGHGHGHGPGWGFGSEGGSDAWREERERRMAELHRRLHEAEADESAGGRSGSQR